MTYTINEEECVKNGLSVAQLLAILIVKLGEHVPTLFRLMEEKEILIKDGSFDSYLVTQRWDDVATTVLLNSDVTRQPEETLECLADALMKVFPQGKKEGTQQYWRGNKRELILRLKKFFKLYGSAYSPDDIIDAAKRYVEGFNGRYSYMRVLKYFIWKDEKKFMQDGTLKVIETSELANYLENAGQDEDLTDDWTSTLK